MRRRLLLSFCLLACSPVAAGADGYAPLRALMGCTEDPAPTVVVEGLLAAGLIADRQGPGVDEDYCWRLSPGLDWNGLQFSRLCVVTDDSSETAAHPEIYWDQSLAPWTEVWLLTSADHDNLKNWAEGALPEESRYEIDDLDGQDTHSALSCSEWWFPLHN